MAETQESAVGVCERCDRESRHLLKLIEPNNSVHYVCWDCVRRAEKRVNVSARWQRDRRA